MRGKKRFLLRGGAALLAILIAFAIALYATSSGLATFGGTPQGARLARMNASGRYAAGEFQNQEPTQLMHGSGALTTTAQFIFGNGEMRVPSCPLPMAKNIPKTLGAASETGLRITWLGHSTTLIEIDERIILTDPMWSERASPSSIAGPKRFHPPPLAFKDLPRIDAVMISHDHYDHLDMATIQALAKLGAPVHVSLGVGAHLERWGVPASQIIEHDWWQATPIDSRARGPAHAVGLGVSIISTPARHFSGRGLRDRNATSWTSWTIVSPKHRVFYSGDTGLTSAFTAIARRYGPFDVAMLEIGQWHEAWGSIHLGPIGALDAFEMLGAKRLFPIHWGTFELALHSWSEPAETLYVNAHKRGLAVTTPMLGQSVEPSITNTKPWWRALPPSSKACP